MEKNLTQSRKNWLDKKTSSYADKKEPYKKHAPKKSLGQNFLTSVGAVNKIILGGAITNKDAILEIGPGRGVLTQKILETGAKVIAIEKDTELIPILEEKFEKEIKDKKLLIYVGDILETDIEALKLPKKYKLIANIPYYITGEIFRMFLEKVRQPETIVVMVQKEVALRAVAKDTKESILSLSIKAYGKPTIVASVDRGSFHPIPNVDSAILKIEHISKTNFVSIAHEKKFFETIKTGFLHKRKKLIQNLKPVYKDIALVFKKLNIDGSARAEEITLEQWLEMSKNT